MMIDSIITTLPFPTKKAVLLPPKSEPIQLFFMSTYHLWCSIFTVSVPWVKKIRDFIVSLCTLRLYFLYQFQKCSSNISLFSSFSVWAAQMLLKGVEVFIMKSKIRKVLNACWFGKNHWGLFCGRQGITFLNSIIPRSEVSSPHYPAIEETQEYWKEEGQIKLFEEINRVENNNQAKNIIFFLGDGMGISTLTAARFAQSLNFRRTFI